MLRAIPLYIPETRFLTADLRWKRSPSLFFWTGYGWKSSTSVIWTRGWSR